MSGEDVASRRLMLAMLVALFAVFAAMPMAYARSCIVNAGTQTYEVSSAVSAETTIVAARTTTSKVFANSIETRKNTRAFSSAGGLSTTPWGSVLILR
jgi:hypothetical protein